MKSTTALISAAILSTLMLGPVTEGRTGKTEGAAARIRKTATQTVKTDKKTEAGMTTPSAATTTPSGLTYVITRRGEGREPRSGDTVVLNYTGLLGSGVKFDSSLDRGKPFSFKLGAGMVIKGWDEGIAKLRVGDQATLIIPPDLGYGARGAGGVIPPGATLIFIVELIEVKE